MSNAQISKIWHYKNILLLLCVYFGCVSYAYEFLYPVAAVHVDGQIKIYVLYQKSVTHIELWLWDPITKLASKGLLSSYTPASLRLLPSQDGFSFIDEGRIRIKKFNRRSPKTIDMYEPIYNINEIDWIDEENFYLSAKQNEQFGIFHVHTNGVIKPIVQDCTCDCMYPQKIGDLLFYIERKVVEGEYKKEHASYKLVKTEYPDVQDAIEDLEHIMQSSDYDLDEKAKKLKAYTQYAGHLSKEYLVDFKASPIAFLHMISPTQGFFLEHPQEIDRHDKTVMFHCFYIEQLKQPNANNQLWSCTQIFSFSIPSYLILDLLDFCLYESMLPLLPKYYDGKIYYVDSSPTKAENLALFAYNLCSKTFEQKTFARTQELLFSPVFTENGIFYGGKINNDTQEATQTPTMWIDAQGSVRIELPYIYVASKRGHFFTSLQSQ